MGRKYRQWTPIGLGIWHLETAPFCPDEAFVVDLFKIRINEEDTARWRGDAGPALNPRDLMLRPMVRRSLEKQGRHNIWLVVPKGWDRMDEDAQIIMLLHVNGGSCNSTRHAKQSAMRALESGGWV